MSGRREGGDRPAGEVTAGDMPAKEFRAAAHRVADLVADYLERLESHSILPPVKPGEVRGRLPGAPPASPEPLDAILADYSSLIEPNITHWQHPGFMAYFASTASGPGILGEMLSAGLNSNVMLWRNAPASTELEQTVVDWLRQMMGLPDGFEGMFTDTASISSLLAVVAAREKVAGQAGRLRLYCSTEAHSSIEKAARVAGVGKEGIARIPADAELRMRADLLDGAIARDRDEGFLPFCVVATIGTTSSTSIDPAAEVAAICARHGLWFHVDAAYAGAAALAPEMRPLFAGWERADSIVFNPHKWLFTPFDASLLLWRDGEAFRDAFSLVPEYLRTPADPQARNFNEYGIQLGRRFRALKLWILIRYFGAEGLAERVREHCRMARELAAWVDADPSWERLAPVPFSTVCLRYRPAGATAEELDRLNEAILARVNESGEIFLSHTRLAGVYTIRVALGNLRQRPEHVARCWELLKEAAGS